MKINRDKFSKYFARFGLIIMSFLIMIPMLCSAASDSITVSITNPDNLPQDMTITYGYSMDFDSFVSIDFGTTTVYDPLVIQFVNGQSSFGGELVSANVPDGYYKCIAFDYSQPEGYYSYLAYGVETIDVEYSGYSLSVGLGDPLLIVNESEYNDYKWGVFMFLMPIPTPTPTDSITNVWTGIMNWITSSLNTVHGLFYQQGTPFSDIGEPSDLTLGGYSFNIVDDFDALAGSFYYDGLLLSSDDLTIDTISIGDVPYLVAYYNDIPVSLSGANNQAYIVNDPLFTLGFNGLTLLGTLAVIGLSIALGFLIIGVIQRFLRLRG